MITVMKKFGMISVRLLPVPALSGADHGDDRENGDEQPRRRGHAACVQRVPQPVHQARSATGASRPLGLK